MNIGLNKLLAMDLIGMDQIFAMDFVPYIHVGVNCQAPKMTI